MPESSRGRRLKLIKGRPDFRMKPGDYCGPVKHADYMGDELVVYFLKPHAADEHVSPMAAVIQHVTSATHSFVEHQDGTLTIKGEIEDVFTDPGTGFAGPSDGWRGTLKKGRWHKAVPATETTEPLGGNE